MRFIKFTLIAISLLLIISCSQNLPENYGFYANTDEGRIILNGQKINFRGNLMESITGLIGASGVQCDSIKNFIVFEKDIDPKSLILSRLEFKRRGSVQNIMSRSNVEVNLWVASKSIDIDIAPVKGRKDMYKITPNIQLPKGFYAIHFGGLSNRSTIEASMGNIAYDFVIGSVDDYLSYDVMKKRNKERLLKETKNLLKELNAFYNDNDIDKIKNIYRPNGQFFSDSKWMEFSSGLHTWFEGAGKVTESKIIKSTITENKGIFTIQTIYTKKGKQTEKLEIQKIDGKYYITSLE